MRQVLKASVAMGLLLGLAACETNAQRFPAFEFTGRIAAPGPP